MRATTTPRKALPPTVWALGFTSLFMDVSSELVHGLLPLFLVVNLGASAVVLGLVEGIAEAAAQIVKVFSGWLSDTLQRRKALAVVGYGLAAVTKPLFPLAGTVALVAFARLVDRIGKGIRGAPRDALVADVTPPAQRGAAFGLLRREIEATIRNGQLVPELAQHVDDLSRYLAEGHRTIDKLLEIRQDPAVLDNACLALSAFGHLVVAWLWLEQAIAATKLGEIKSKLRESKLATCRFFFECELPNVTHQFALLKSMNGAAASVPLSVFE